MAHYRFYVFENNGKLMGTGDFQSATDDTATECIKQLVRGHDGEIWGQVARIDSSIKPSSRESVFTRRTFQGCGDRAD
jgi:hypothetical protein